MSMNVTASATATASMSVPPPPPLSPSGRLPNRNSNVVHVQTNHPEPESVKSTSRLKTVLAIVAFIAGALLIATGGGLAAACIAGATGGKLLLGTMSLATLAAGAVMIYNTFDSVLSLYPPHTIPDAE